MGYIGSDPKTKESVSTSQLINDSVTNEKIVDDIQFNSVTSSIVSASADIIADTFSGTFSGALSSSAQIADNISGSFTPISSSVSSRLTLVEDGTTSKALVSASAISSAAQGQVTLTTNGVAATAVDLGLQSSDSPTFADVTVTGTLTAQEIHTEFESASVIFTSGSTIFGDTIDDTHKMTGSLFVSGAIHLPDEAKINLGSSNDGNIKHSGTNLQIQETTGNIQLINYANDKDISLSTDDGSGGTTAYITLDGSATTVEVAKNTNFAGDIDVDGTTNLDVVDIDGAVDMASKLVVAGQITGSSTTLLGGNVSISSQGNGLSLSRSGYDTYAFQHSTGNGMAIFNVSDDRNEMHFKGDGVVGIGTATPLAKLHVEHTTDDTDENGNIALTVGGGASGDVRHYFGINNSGNYAYQGAVEHATQYVPLVLQPNGSLVSIGSPTHNTRVGQQLALTAGGGSNRGGIAINTYLADTQSPLIDFNRSRSNTVGSHNGLSSGDGIGTLVWRGSDGDEFVDAAALAVEVDGSTGNNDVPGRMMFFTTPDGTNSLVERMRITNSGRVGINTTAPEALLHVSGSQGSGNVALFQRKEGANNTSYMVSIENDDTTSNQGAGLNVRAGNDSGDVTFNAVTRDGTYGIRVIGDGKVGVGTDTPAYELHLEGNSGNEMFMIKNKGSGPQGMLIHFSAAAPDNSTNKKFAQLYDNVADRVAIWSDGDIQNHDNSYGQISDERIKTSITDANSQWDDIKALKVKNFKRKDDVSQYGDNAWTQIGVIAQDLESAGMDKLVKHTPPSEFEINNCGIAADDYTKGVKYSVLYMKAVKALQEAMTRIETLETQMSQVSGSL